MPVLTIAAASEWSAKFPPVLALSAQVHSPRRIGASPKRLSSPEIFETGWLWAQPWRNHVDCQRSYKTPAPLMSCAQQKLSSRLDGCRHYNLDNLARPSFEVATDQAKPHPHHTTQPSGRGVID